jgi:hypothetical protein
MFASMSSDALRWGMPPYTTEVIDMWMSNLPNMIPLVAVDNAHSWMGNGLQVFSP